MSSCLSERHSRSMKTLSIQRPRPSMEMAMPAATSTPVKALIGVEDLRRAALRQRFLQGSYAEGDVHRVRQPPRQNCTAGPVDDRHQIEKSRARYVRRPELVHPLDRKSPQQIG